jgi:hypothetical protein
VDLKVMVKYLLELSQASIPVDVQQQGNKIIARFLGAKCQKICVVA